MTQQHKANPVVPAAPGPLPGPEREWTPHPLPGAEREGTPHPGPLPRAGRGRAPHPGPLPRGEREWTPHRWPFLRSGQIVPLLGLLITSSAWAQVAVVPAAIPPPPAVPKWTGSAAAGLALTAGNSKTLLITLTGRADKKWEINEVNLGADA